jgi:carboxyl-terminal processing protease
MAARSMRSHGFIKRASRGLLLVLLACLGFEARAIAAETPCQPVVEFDVITAAVTEHFYDRTFRGLDWLKRVATARNKVRCQDDTQAVAAKLNRLLSELHASHTGVYTQRDPDYWALQSVFSQSVDQHPVSFSGIWPLRVERRWYAKYVLPGSPAAESGVEAGDELISIDGKPFQPLGFSATKASTLVLSRDGRRKQSLPISARMEPMQKFFLDATRASARRIPVGAHDVGYFHLWAGTHELFLASLNSALAEFEEQRVDALVLDLRGGFGGAGPEYLEKLQDSAYLARVPKYFLIDDGVRSGKEWVSGSVKSQKLGTLVGSKTAGMFLAGAPYHFFDDRYLLYLAVEAFEPPGIGKIEGVGIAPDVPVAPCRKYCAGKDPQFDKAEELIRALPAPVAAARAG